MSSILANTGPDQHVQAGSRCICHVPCLMNLLLVVPYLSFSLYFSRLHIFDDQTLWWCSFRPSFRLLLAMKGGWFVGEVLALLKAPQEKRRRRLRLRRIAWHTDTRCTIWHAVLIVQRGGSHTLLSRIPLEDVVLRALFWYNFAQSKCFARSR